MPTLSPLTLLSALLPKPAGGAGEVAMDGEFAALLDEITQQTAVATPPAGAAPPPETAEPAALPGQSLPPGLPVAPILPAPAEVAELPQPGRTLPPPLPDAVTGAEGEVIPQGPRKEKPRPLKAPDLALPETAPDHAPPQVQEQVAVAVALHEPVVTIPSAIPAPTPPAAERPSAIASEPEVRVAPYALQPAIAQPEPMRTERAAQSAPRRIAEQPAGIDQPAQPSAQLPISPEPATEQAPPAITAPLRQLVAALSRDERRGQVPLPMPDAAPLHPQIAAPVSPVPTAGSEVPVPRPHDFGALIDRIAAAREAVQPQAVSMALPHSEFGPIALRFHHDETGLVVSMTSRDPAFAPAAAQALSPTVQAAPGDGGPAPGQGGTGDRGHSPGEQSPQTRQQHRDPREAQRQPSQTSSRDEPGERPHRPGIFA